MVVGEEEIQCAGGLHPEQITFFEHKIRWEKRGNMSCSDMSETSTRFVKHFGLVIGRSNTWPKTVAWLVGVSGRGKRPPFRAPFSADQKSEGKTLVELGVVFGRLDS